MAVSRGSQLGLSLIIVIVVILVVFVVVFLGIFLWFNLSQSTSFNQDKDISSIETDSHPKVFMAKLEYDPVKNLTTQLETKTTKGHIPVAVINKPQKTEDDFIYQIVLVNSENEIISSGWEILSKEIISKENNKYALLVTTEYIPSTIVRLYNEDGVIIWTGYME